jgi:hypothetical protein
MSEQLVVPKKEKRKIKLEELKHEIVEFPGLDYKTRKGVVRDYMKAWEPVFEEELRLGIIKPPLEEEIWNRWHSELYTKYFRKGQMVLMAEIEGQWEPIRSIRSLIWRIYERKVLTKDEWEGTELEGIYPPEQMSEIKIGKPPETYPNTWNLATNYGHGYTTIQMIENGERRTYEGTDYEKIQNSSKEDNKKHKLVLSNYAVQEGGDSPDDVRISGATRAIIKERGEFAEGLGLGCDTYTPATGFSEYLLGKQISDEDFEKDREFYSERHILETILPAAAGGKTNIRDAAAMHLHLGANFVGYLLDARAYYKLYIITSYKL